MNTFYREVSDGDYSDLSAANSIKIEDTMDGGDENKSLLNGNLVDLGNVLYNKNSNSNIIINSNSNTNDRSRVGIDDSGSLASRERIKTAPQLRRLNDQVKLRVSSPSDNLSPLSQRLMAADRVKGYVFCDY